MVLNHTIFSLLTPHLYPQKNLCKGIKKFSIVQVFSYTK